MTDNQAYQTAQAIKALPLGKRSDYISTYTPSLLQPVPRQLNRDELQLGHTLPFTGCDIWNLYELSWLNLKGKPIVATGVVTVPAQSTHLIESKSFKLYLNSFNQSRFASMEQVAQILQDDLSQCAEGQVLVTLHPLTQPFPITELPGECLDDLDISVDDYNFNRDLLKNSTDSKLTVIETLYSNLLKSNCLVTNQPDWGSVMIQYQGPKIDRQALLRYLISFRQHNEFHEQCVERIFTDLSELCRPEKLTVYARYTRRGGLDINPLRSNVEANMPNWRLIRQ
jgi:7-cyano-7-deazaguanine reductase